MPQLEAVSKFESEVEGIRWPSGAKRGKRSDSPNRAFASANVEIRNVHDLLRAVSILI